MTRQEADKDDNVIAIAVQGLAKRFGEVRAVADVSFEVIEGELFGFLPQRRRQDHHDQHAHRPGPPGRRHDPDRGHRMHNESQGCATLDRRCPGRKQSLSRVDGFR